MSIEFKLPAVGENIDKAEIGGLRVAVGDTIAADQIVMEIETDKAVFELPCPTAGKVTKIHVKPGDSVQTGATLLTLDESAVGGGKAASQPAQESSQTSPTVTTAARAPAPPPKAAVSVPAASATVAQSAAAAPASQSDGTGGVSSHASEH